MLHKDNTQDIAARLDRIEVQLVEMRNLLVSQRTLKDYYSTAEVAVELGKAEFTVREWCRHGRVRADKRHCGRGTSKEWMINHDELTRIRNEGLLPLRTS
ncbi:DNA-binding protein [Isosphaeraceae bacterium EP7]